MPAAILYLLKVNLLVLLFYIAYWVLLRKLTFYTYNRYFLLGSLLLSAVFPLLDLSYFYAQPSQLGAEIIILMPDWAGNTYPVQQEPREYWGWLMLVCALGSAVVAVRFILQFVSFWQLHKNSEPASWEGQCFRKLQGEVGPFSFWRTIYLNPKQHTIQELQALLLHEKAHADQLHSLDIILSQLLMIGCWFNPAVWLLQRDVRQNLEFIADQQVLQQGLERKAYQYSLVRVSTQLLDNNLVMSFNFNHIKNRIAMMNKTKSNSLHKLKYLFLPPSVLVLALVVTTSKAEVDLMTQGLNQSINEELQDTTSKKSSVTIVGGEQDGVVYYLDGKRTDADKIKSINPDQIEKVDVLKGERAQSLIGAEEVKGLVVITTKAGKNSSEAQSLQKKLDALQGGTGKSSSFNFSYENTSDSGTAIQVGRDVLYLLDDKEISYEEMKAIDPNNIASVDVVKNKEAVEKYGEKGKNGVVHIKTKN
ncbi:M56 family metallopeptidase [Pontibacter korlensis]|uniref:Peptidase M56 domain-containing protein n=1 Tax=Pontibacter korlensis TaxID=400092 RepID=A0A0E3UXR7_9BACT|nr:M56 family metallopeptidase [Pontibacter korlensis]AKD04497.1 hypothetical protein PKOR_17120 [Pontibacter korlensis]